LANLFRNILIPVDFTINTELAIKKGVQLAETGEEVALHLLHVIKPGDGRDESPAKNLIPVISNREKKLIEDAALKLQECKEYMQHDCLGINIFIHLARNHSIEQAIVKKAMEIKPELIVVAKHSYHKWLASLKRVSAVNIARKSHCAVLIMKPGSLHTKIKSIVIPVRSFFPRRKLQLLPSLANRKKVTIYFLSILNESNGYDGSSASDAFIETLRLLHGNVNCQLEHKLISGNNIAKDIFQFAENVDADVLLANPDEAKVSSITNLDISDLVRSSSKLQILAVDPAHVF